VGCLRPLTEAEPQFKCQFCDTGFEVENFCARPCRTCYHIGCIQIGTPFTTRISNDAGLFCPQDLASQQQFICEACTVRSVLLEEIGFRPIYVVSMMLERARLVDTTNNWSKGALRTYKSKFNVLIDFKRDLKVRVVPYTHPSHPPNGPAIRLVWAQERYSLYPADWWKRNVMGEEAIKFGTVRALRSAASHFWSFDMLLSKGDQLTFGFKDRPQMVQACSPTDQVTYTYFTEGMRQRLGNHPKPSTVLTGRHMKWLDTYYRQLLANATQRRERARFS
jgi:hypothetical protein